MSLVSHALGRPAALARARPTGGPVLVPLVTAAAACCGPSSSASVCIATGLGGLGGASRSGCGPAGPSRTSIACPAAAVGSAGASEAPPPPAMALGPSGAAAGAPESRSFAVAMAKVADETKCQDLVVLDVAPVVSWTSFLVIATVASKPQLMATLARVEKAASEQFSRARLNLPGTSPWETLDFGDVVVHVFTAQQREYYDIESFYAAAEEVDLPFLEQQLPASGQPAGSGARTGPEPTWATKA